MLYDLQKSKNMHAYTRAGESISTLVSSREHVICVTGISHFSLRRCTQSWNFAMKFLIERYFS